MDNLLVCPQGQFSLKRLPQQPRELLQAWDAADEYLLTHISDLAQLQQKPRILIINDSFGALTVALNQYQPTAISDSFLSQDATRLNLEFNGLDGAATVLASSIEYPAALFDLVLIKVPKTLALLEDELIRLRPLITTDTQIIVAGMVKGMPASVWKLLERIIGPTTTSLAKKKARLIFVTPDPSLPLQQSPYPGCYILEGTQYQICNHANVFSRESLDIGTRLFLKHIPTLPDAHDIIDLGCGNGVVGLIAAERNPAATIHFIDESHMAVASAIENFRQAFGIEYPATFQLGDGLANVESDSADLVLCNPPFHQQSAVGDHIAQKMFSDSQRVLKSGGELWIVGNRHLGYHKSLKQIFGNVTLIDSNKKFVVLRAIKP
jgi:23S rRNA (guanine1835-N2)-methyltransferase